jgi:hypothetical protein
MRDPREKQLRVRKEKQELQARKDQQEMTDKVVL